MTTVAGQAITYDDRLHVEAEWVINDDSVTDMVRTLHELRETMRALKEFDGALTDAIAAEMRYGVPIDIDGVGRAEVRRGKQRTRWDKESLRRAVLDSRLANEDGEIVDESPLDKVEHVWNLGQPRVTALRDRGIDPDEFCEAVPGKVTVTIT